MPGSSWVIDPVDTLISDTQPTIPCEEDSELRSPNRPIYRRTGASLESKCECSQTGGEGCFLLLDGDTKTSMLLLVVQ